MKLWIADCHDPQTGNHARFQVRARTYDSADGQARDGYFGLLAPPPPERRAELEVKLTDCGEVR